MKPASSVNSDFYDSLNSNIEVHIIFSQDGAPYCEFMPNWKLLQTCQFFPEALNQPSGYIMSDCGYAESYPMFSIEDLD